MASRAITVFLLAVGLVTIAGCQKGARTHSAPSINASSAGSGAIAQYDANKDGKINGAELDTAPALKAALAQIDKDKDGAITAEEISTRIKEWQESKWTVATINIVVQRNGKPLTDADVKLVPEKFLGDNLVAATGKTDRSGKVSPSVPLTQPGDLPGLAPGLYRMEVTKAGANIPAKYNTESTLGVEIAADAPWAIGMAKELRVNLK